MKASPLPAALAAALVALALALAFAPHAHAQDYPNRAVRIIVPYAAGGLPDVAMRTLAQQFSAQLGQPFTIENLPGANGSVGIAALLNAPADGYTLFSADPGHWAVTPAINPKSDYDPQREFVPVGLYAEHSPIFLVVGETLPVHNLHELVALARAQPGVLTYASPGIGSQHQLIMEDFKGSLGLDIRHIPYRSNAQAIPALIGGQVSMAIAAAAVVVPYAKDGRIRALGVARKERAAVAPQAAPMGDAGIPGFDHGGSLGLLARAGTPQQAIDVLSAALAKALAVPDVAARLAAIGLDPVQSSSPAALAARMSEDRAKYARIVKQLGGVLE
jgi:tripartite-type tricarboxylate transporter receptor subunit TctC